MDGTLTNAVHDFDAIKRALDIPLSADILSHLAALPTAEAAAKHAWLLAHGRELALAATAATGAVQLVQALHLRGCKLAILTRNARELALITLQAIGVAEYFAPAQVLGRDEAAPKPDPDGLFKLAQVWQVEPSELVMVGDFHYDLACARAAGARSVLVNQTQNLWPQLSDYFAIDCHALQALLP